MFQAVLRVRFVTRDPGRTQLLVVQRERIFEAIRRRDPAGATGAMVAHLGLMEGEIRGFGERNSRLPQRRDARVHQLDHPRRR
jgi:DNA-binding FadR family transcriptional regulator